MWDDNAITNLWTFVKGTDSVYNNGYYGIKTISNSNNMPSGHIGSISWKDINGNVWIFGGQGLNGYYNDLWRYVPDTACPHISRSGEGIYQPVSNNLEISLYPNPTSGIITINNLRLTNNDLRITDVLGREVYHQAISNQQTAIINLSQLSTGVYFYKIIGEKETASGKFVIMR